MIHRATLLLRCAAAGLATAGLATAGLASAGQAAPPAAAPTPLRPFQTSYEVSWHGFTGGTASFELRQDAPGSWTYVNRNRPSGLFRLVPKASLTLTSRMSVEPAAVRPLLFTATTADGDETKAELHFDWGASRARGYFDERPIDMALKPGVQDDLSVQVALINALANGQVPAGISLFDPNGIRDYDYSEVGTETLQTPAGEFATVIYRSHKQNSPRSTRFWCAPALGYIPVKAEQQYKGKVEWTMRLVSVHRD